MRVTNSGYADSLASQATSLMSRQATLQNQVATGQRVTKPSDDPGAFARVMADDAEAKSCQQYKSNIDQLLQEAKSTASIVNSLKTITSRAAEIATLANNTKAPEDLQNYATEITQLIQQAAQAANTQYNGEYSLGGTATGQAPFQVTLNAQGLVQQVTYAGNTNQKSVEIDNGVTMSITPPGVNGTTSGARGLLTDATSGSNFFQHMIDLQNHLQQGDTTAIANTDLANLDRDENNVLYHLSANAAMQSRLEAGGILMDNRIAALKADVSNETDVDLSTAITQLTKVQTSYNAALQSGAKLMNTSLLDYIR